MQPKGMEDLVAFNAREVKRPRRKEKETSISLQKDSGSQSRRQSHPSKLSENRRKEDACCGKRLEREGQLEELVGDQNVGPEAPSRSRRF